MPKVINDRSKCISCQACTTVCDQWVMDPDGKARVKSVELKSGQDKYVLELKSLGCHEEAASICPTNAIRVVK